MASTFSNYMTRFHGAQTTTPGAPGYYREVTEAANQSDNCFAYAVGKPGRINSQTRAQLTTEYESMHFYEVDKNGAPQPGDAEIYAKPSTPNQIVHAHKVVNATTARSKLGGGELIEHHIATLQAPRAPNVNTYEYGTLIMRFRRDDARYTREWTTTRSGRPVKRKAGEDDMSASKKPKPAPAVKPAAKPAAKSAAKPVVKKH
ncbi:hypothetical protein DHEL01_v207153 [Diaporthe helianthi]|uniref:DUF7689 domain-containing protein n=1 Tax=Diaporthe helianthi TaxID=158607 RepID=A0A2P5HW38_DIAHE|nr:hypothetical protein DHEL01_v207153 [Diaporthe helianthi]